jgi:cardiolipin synthase
MAVATSGRRRGAVSTVLRVGACVAVLAFRNLANILTTVRLLATLPLVLLVLSGAFASAFWLFLLAAATDLVDGSVAKYLNRPTRFGALLDPFADKIFSGSLFLSMALVELVPWWLAGLVVLRDVAIGTGALLLGRRLADFRIEPLVIGKLCTLIQLVFLGSLLAQQAGIAALGDWLASALWAVVGFTIASGLAYLGAGLRLARHGKAR